MAEKFRKKPVVIEAMLFDGTAQATEAILRWAPQIGMDYEPRDNTVQRLSIYTLEGVMHAVSGDWIIKGVAGEFYPCKPDIFEQTYERVEDSND